MFYVQILIDFLFFSKLSSFKPMIFLSLVYFDKMHDLKLILTVIFGVFKFI